MQFYAAGLVIFISGSLKVPPARVRAQESGAAWSQAALLEHQGCRKQNSIWQNPQNKARRGRKSLGAESYKRQRRPRERAAKIQSLAFPRS